jgi:hypothetical protein
VGGDDRDEFDVFDDVVVIDVRGWTIFVVGCGASADADRALFPHAWWCCSQSLCWQNAPQYRAKLHPEQVSFALRPQFQHACQNDLKNLWILNENPLKSR